MDKKLEEAVVLLGTAKAQYEAAKAEENELYAQLMKVRSRVSDTRETYDRALERVAGAA